MKLSALPSWPQRQDSLANQLADLITVANRLGFYDAADAVKQWASNPPGLEYGCYCETGDDGPDDCVLDVGSVSDCVIAQRLDSEGKLRKENCEYWRIVK